MHKLLLQILLTPLIFINYLLITVLFLPFLIISWLPKVGSSVFVAGMVVISPFFMLAQYFGGIWMLCGAEKIRLHNDSIDIESSFRKNNYHYADIAQISETFVPPFIQVQIELVSGSTLKLNPCTNTEDLLSWATKLKLQVTRFKPDTKSSQIT